MLEYWLAGLNAGTLQNAGDALEVIAGLGACFLACLPDRNAGRWIRLLGRHWAARISRSPRRTGAEERRRSTTDSGTGTFLRSRKDRTRKSERFSFWLPYHWSIEVEFSPSTLQSSSPAGAPDRPTFWSRKKICMLLLPVPAEQRGGGLSSFSLSLLPLLTSSPSPCCSSCSAVLHHRC